jgi:opacity protein-like surface antigen
MDGSRKNILLANLPQSSGGAEDWRGGALHLLDCGVDGALPFLTGGVGGDDGEAVAAGR